jgi:pimeloyl-ACP methyl ester carboxylesterase
MTSVQALSIATPVAPARRTAPRKERIAPLEQDAIALATGVRLRYVEHGDRGGVPVVLLHGVTDSWRSFEAMLPHLPESIRAFALTQRGHGDSERPVSGYRTRDFAADIAEFLDAMSLPSAVIVGHSMGTTNALRFAIDHPQRTRGLLLAGTFASYRRSPVIIDLWESAIAAMSGPVNPGFVREFQQSTLAQPVPADLLDTAIEESLKVPASIWRAAFAGMREDDFVNGLDEIAAPTLLLWGDRDALIPRADQDTLLNAIAGSRLVVYRGAGHAPHWEEPARFARDLTAFVERCG